MVIFVFARKYESIKIHYKYLIINNELSVLGHGANLNTDYFLGYGSQLIFCVIGVTF